MDSHTKQKSEFYYFFKFSFLENVSEELVRIIRQEIVYLQAINSVSVEDCELLCCLL